MYLDQESDARTGLARLALAAPPLPGTLVGITRLLDHPQSVDVDHVTRLVSHDPIVVARLLKIANSAYYGLQRTVTSAERAVDLLGPVTVTGIVMGMSMLRLPSVFEGPAAACFMRLVRHSMATALFAREIVRRVRPDSDLAETAFTAGLLHDLGRLLLVYHEPERAVALYERADLLRTDDPETVLELEQLGFGYDHVEAGEFVARRLDFPDPLVEAIRHHLRPAELDRTQAHFPVVAATACAVVAASALGFSFVGATPWSDAARDPVWTLLGAADLPRLQQGLVAEADSIRVVVDELLSIADSRDASAA